MARSAKKSLTAGMIKNVLAEEIERIQNGKTTPTKTNSIVSSVEAYLDIFRVQIKAAEITGKMPDFSALLES